MWNAFIQAMERIKCPKGEEPSAALVYMSKEDMDDVIKHSTCEGELKAPEVILCWKNGKIDYNLIKSHMLGDDFEDDFEDSSENNQNSTQNSNQYHEPCQPQNSENQSEKSHENINSNSQQSKKPNQFAFRKRNIQIYTVMPEALLHIYNGGCGIKKFSIGVRDAENGFGISRTENAKNGVNEESASDYDFRRINQLILEDKTPIVTELFFSTVEVKVCGFTGLQLSEIKSITTILDSVGIRPLILKHPQQEDATKIENESYSIHIITKLCLAKTAKFVCEDTLEKAKNSGISGFSTCEIFPKYSRRKLEKDKGCNEYKLSLVNGELIYDYKTKQFVGYHQDLVAVINDLIMSAEVCRGYAVFVEEESIN
jgi:hypothetical protein